METRLGPARPSRAAWLPASPRRGAGSPSGQRACATAECIFACGRRNDPGSRWCWATRGRSRRWLSRQKETDTSPAPRSTPAPALDTDFASTRTPRCIRIPPLDSSRRARPVRRWWWIRRAFIWTDGEWTGVSIQGQVIYEMHVGTFTPARTWAAAMRELGELARLGVTCVEIMPIAEFPGQFGWGYDGVDLFAPTHLYGEPDDLRRFVDRGPRARARRHPRRRLQPPRAGRQLPPATSRPTTSPTGTRRTGARRINFDGPGSGPVREFFLANARAWIEEFHFDGLRLDATQSIFDDSAEHLLAAIGREVRAAARGRADHHRGGERAPAHAPRAPTRARRLRARRALERRPPPQRDGRPHREERGLLHRLQRHAPGVHLGGEVGLPVPGSALQVAAGPPGHARAGSAARGLRDLHREPRSGRQLRPWTPRCTR